MAKNFEKLIFGGLHEKHFYIKPSLVMNDCWVEIQFTFYCIFHGSSCWDILCHIQIITDDVSPMVLPYHIIISQNINMPLLWRNIALFAVARRRVTCRYLARPSEGIMHRSRFQMWKCTWVFCWSFHCTSLAWGMGAVTSLIAVLGDSSRTAKDLHTRTAKDLHTSVT
jgi:hypothetical protein